MISPINVNGYFKCVYPDYVRQALARAKDEGRWYCRQADAAAWCFDVLALFPDCEDAKELVYELFCDEWTIYDNRDRVQPHSVVDNENRANLARFSREKSSMGAKGVGVGAGFVQPHHY